MAESSTPQPGLGNEIALPDTPARWLLRLLKGIAVGVGAILPGLSGGVLAVIFKLYDPLIRFLANVRRDFVSNVAYFIPVGIGVGLGILGFSVVVAAAFGIYAAQFTCLFIGFVIGTFPSLYRQAGRHGRGSTDFIIMGAAALGIFLLMYLGGEGAWLQLRPSVPIWFVSGALIGLGVIVPGMSPSNFLIYFGLYDLMATGIKSFDVATILPLALGLVICIMAFAKAAAWAFDRYYSGMYHFILGMVLGSSLAIFPTIVFPAFAPAGLASSGLTRSGSMLFAAGLLVVGIAASYLFSKVEDRYAEERQAIDSTGR